MSKKDPVKRPRGRPSRYHQPSRWDLSVGTEWLAVHDDCGETGAANTRFYVWAGNGWATEDALADEPPSENIPQK